MRIMRKKHQCLKWKTTHWDDTILDDEEEDIIADQSVKES